MSDQFLEGATIENQHRPPFFMIDNRVHDDWIAKIGVYAFAVYCSLVRRSDSHGACYPSSNRVAQDLGISKGVVIKAMGILEDHGLIRRVPRYVRETRERTSDCITILPLPKDKVVHDVTEVVHDVTDVGHDTHLGGTPEGQEEDVLTRPSEEDPSDPPPKHGSLIPPKPTQPISDPFPNQPPPSWERAPSSSVGESVGQTKTGGDPLPEKTFTPKEVDPLGRKRTGKSDPHMVVFWWEDKTGVGVPGHSFARALKDAKQLLESGVLSISELEDLYEFGGWRISKGGAVCLSDMLFDVMKWRASKVVPKPKAANRRSQEEQDREYWNNFV